MTGNETENHGGLRVRNVWRLHLTRNAIMPRSKKDAETLTDDKASHFYVFDYFDKMVCRRVHSTANDHRFIFGLNQPPDDVPPTASHYLTLASLEGEAEEEDPFFYSETGKSSTDLSGMPFLSVILVTIMSMEEDASGGAGDMPGEEKVKDFLISCAGSLRKTAETAYDDFRTKQGAISRPGGKSADEAQMKCRVLHCINSGNFCVAVRTNRPELSYYIAMRIRGNLLNEPKIPGQRQFGFPRLFCSTFTITGMEYRENERHMVSALAEEKARELRAEVVMRFSVPDHRLIRELYQMEEDSSEGRRDVIRTLYGRYDATLTLSMGTFMKIYPWICYSKFNAAPLPLESIEKESNSAIKRLMVALCDKRVEAINERILVDASYIDLDKAGVQNIEAVSRIRQDMVRNENLAVLSMFDDLLKLADNLPWHREEYCHYLHILRDLWKSYSSLRYQDDSFINGNMFLSQMWLVLADVERYLRSVPEQFEGGRYTGKFTCDKIAYEDLMTSLHRAIHSISHFQKLMQSINQQSLMAPNYEVQMHTDLEKFMIAYTEFSREFLSNGFHSDKRKRQLILPVFMMDMTKTCISAIPMFLLPYWTTKDEGLCESNRETECLLLSIILPDIETFGSLYTTLPAICHELSHNFRIMERKERNDALCQFILHKVSMYVIKLWISHTSEAVYSPFGTLETWLSSALEDVLWEQYCEHYGSAHPNANIGALISNMQAFLLKYFFIDADNATRYDLNVSPAKIRKFLERMCGLYQRSASVEGKCWFKDYLACHKQLGDMEKLERNIDLETKDDKTGEWKNSQNRWKECAENVRCLLSKKIPGGETSEGYTLGEWIFSDIIERQCFQTADADNQLFEYAEYFDLATPEIRKIHENAQKDFADSDLVKKVYPYAMNADLWIQKIQLEIIAPCEKLLSELPTPKVQLWEEEHSGKFVRKRLTPMKIRTGLEIHAQNLLHTARDACHTLKDANYLYGVLAAVASERFIFDDFRLDRRILLNRLHSELRIRTRNLQDAYLEKGAEKPFLWLIRGSAEMMSLLTPLCMDMEDSSAFRRSIEAALRVQGAEVKKLVNESTTLYREVFADLGMCLAMELDAFGYLMVMARNRSLSGKVTDKGDVMPRLDRMDLVCWTLLSHAAPGMESAPSRWKGNRKRALDALRETCANYYRNMKTRVLQEVEKTACPELNRTFFDVLQRTLDEPERAEFIEPLPPVLKDLPGWLRSKPAETDENRQERYRTLAKEMENLWMAVCFSSHIILIAQMAENAILRFDRKLGEHFISLYERMYASTHSESEQPTWTPSHVLRAIGGLYRQGTVGAFFQSPEHSVDAVRPELRDTLSFVLYYYYRNWHIYGDWNRFRDSFSHKGSGRKEKERAFLNQWLDGLMGGESK